MNNGGSFEAQEKERKKGGNAAEGAEKKAAQKVKMAM